jgi:hypothetical protein
MILTSMAFISPTRMFASQRMFSDSTVAQSPAQGS